MAHVTIIIPNYNHALFLVDRIDSILNQTYKNYEIILLDDCSTDKSIDLIESYRDHPKVSHIIYNDTNSGTSYKQWDKGISYAKGDLIWIAESDDWCTYEFLKSGVLFFENPKIVLVYSNTQFVYNGDIIQNTPSTGEFEIYDGNDFIREKMIARNHICNASGVIFRKDRYLQVRDCGFLEMKLCGDWLLWTAIMSDMKIVSLKDTLNFCRRHDHNATSKFRALGLDFIEGMDVLNASKKLCKKDFDRVETYQSWRQYYRMIKPEFNKGINLKVMINILFKEPLLFLYLNYKNLKKGVKDFLKFKDNK